MTLKMIMKALMSWMVANKHVGQLFCGEVRISWHNGVPNRKMKIVHHVSTNE